eukprot:TRINITY_DN96224_c0_g1_i1.p1 TRINITY_DN96224_c0_g1~~TRINITY_DN96224_c0_g1_i1.p1  ORF type:complete len:435 (+),score=52.90 TRINITY_DN96224_c0_g1_i1:56-1306(+)
MLRGLVAASLVGLTRGDEEASKHLMGMWEHELKHEAIEAVNASVADVSATVGTVHALVNKSVDAVADIAIKATNATNKTLVATRKKILHQTGLPKQDDRMPPDIAILIVFAVASASTSMSGFGQAIIWTSGMRVLATQFDFAFRPEKLVALLAIGEISVACVTVLLNAKSIMWCVVAQVGIPMLALIPMGNVVLNYVDMTKVGRAIGVCILLHCFYGIYNLKLAESQVRAPAESSDEEAERDEEATRSLKEDRSSQSASEETDYCRQLPPVWMAVVVGLIAGVFGGSSGVVGPVLAVYFLGTGLQKTQIKATVQCMALGLFCINVLLLRSEGILQPLRDVESVTMLTLGGLAGIPLGICLHDKFSDGAIRYSIFSLCIVASCGLIGGSNEALTIKLMLASAFILILAVCAPPLKIW